MQGKFSLKPVLKLEGAQLDGGDLLLPANMTEDRRSLVALTPASQMPLSAGDHPLRLSLNGQFSEQTQRDIVRALPMMSSVPGISAFYCQCHCYAAILYYIALCCRPSQQHLSLCVLARASLP